MDCVICCTPTTQTVFEFKVSEGYKEDEGDNGDSEVLRKVVTVCAMMKERITV